MSLAFTKMHALGNDFMVVDGINQHIDYLPANALSNRFTGIGFDQLLLIQPSDNADFFCKIINGDGSEAEQCGNGLRCVARYLHEQGFTEKTQISIETISGIYPAVIHSYDNIHLTMGVPNIIEESLSLQLPNNDFVNEVFVLSVGNPHAVLRVSDVCGMDIQVLGSQISHHEAFNQGTNVGFMEVLSPSHIRLRTFERGAGETNACGSNACAAVVAGITQGWLENKVDVEFKYGRLSISWKGNGQPIEMSGPAVYVYHGNIILD